MSVIGAAVNLIVSPLMIFKNNTTVYQSGKQKEILNFDQISTSFEKKAKLTSVESQEINEQHLGVSTGLLETFYGFYVLANKPNAPQALSKITSLLSPTNETFKTIQWQKISYTKVKNKQGKLITKKHITISSMPVLTEITRYNGTWKTSYRVITTTSGTHQIVWGQPAFIKGNYKNFREAEKIIGFPTDKNSEQIIFSQALLQDPSFFDPNAISLINSYVGISSSGAPPSQGNPIAKPQIIAILQQAINIDNVPKNWLPGLEIIVNHEDASGNPTAVDPILVDGQHASGLMQMLPSTFWADHLNGYNNIWNPLDNAVSALRHIKGTWGTPYNIPGVVSGQYTGY